MGGGVRKAGLIPVQLESRAVDAWGELALARERHCGGGSRPFAGKIVRVWDPVSFWQNDQRVIALGRPPYVLRSPAATHGSGRVSSNGTTVASFAWSYLYTLAAVSVTFVGFSSLVIVLRQTMGGEMSSLDVLIARTFIQVGFLVAGGAMFPALLSLFHLGEPSVWRISSAVTALPVILFAVTYPTRRKTASGVRTPLVIWIDVLVILGFGVLMGCNALGIWVSTGPGPYAAALTGVLFVSGWAYLQAVNTLIRHHRVRSEK